jgi:hypothetical protein
MNNIRTPKDIASRTCQLAAAALGGFLISMAMVSCSHDGPDSLASNAVLAAAGGRMLTYTPPLDGTVTVYDQQNNEVIYSGKASKGDRIVADVEHDRITLNGRTVCDHHLNSSHEHRIYFEPTPTTSK